MRTFTAPSTLDAPTDGRLTDDVLTHLRERPDAVGFSVPSGSSGSEPGSWTDVTYAQFHADVTATARGLVAAGIQVGDRIGLMSRTRYEWTVLDYAIWWAGAASVPIYETSSPDQMAWFLRDSGAVACVVETPEHLGRVTAVCGDLPDLVHVWSITDGGLGALRSLGADIDHELLERRRTSVHPDSLATLIYTSGTTGQPKGCVLSHAAFMVELAVATRALQELFEGEDASTLLFLPLAHVFARIIEVGCIKAGARLGHTADVQDLMTSLAQFRPSFVLAVPQVFEKIYNSASQDAQVEGKGRIFDTATHTAIAWSRAHDEPNGPGLKLRVRHRVFDRLVYRALRRALGGRVRQALSGGAPLGDRLSHFFRGVGLPVLEGYGLTETTGAITVNLPGAQRIGTVGRPLPGVSVRVDDGGELSFRGPQVFDGYWRQDEATAEVLSPDGWLRTGDIGEIDHEGFVRITGRRKEILVTAGGKSVAPALLEDSIRAHPLVGQVLVVGDGKPFIGALVTLDPEGVAGWNEQHGTRSDAAALARDSEVRTAIQHGVDDANALVSRAESIRAFRILATDWTEDSGHLTPSLKLKRTQVMRDFGAEVERLYDRDAPPS